MIFKGLRFLFFPRHLAILTAIHLNLLSPTSSTERKSRTQMLYNLMSKSIFFFGILSALLLVSGSPTSDLEDSFIHNFIANLFENIFQSESALESNWYEYI